MEPSTEGNLLEIMDLARTLRQEQLFIQQEQAAFAQLSQALGENSTSITKLAYICAQQRRNLNDLVTSRPESGPLVCCKRAKSYDNAKFVDAKKILSYEQAIFYEELFNHLYRSPYVLAYSLATGDRLAEITPQHLSSIIHIITTGLFGNAINTKDVEMMLKLLRELIEIQIVVSDDPRRLLRANASAFSRLYNRLNESMFSAKVFLTAALYEPIMGVLRDSETILDVDPKKVVQSLSSKERLKRFGLESSTEYQQNVDKFHAETISKLYSLAKSFIDSFSHKWSLFPSTLRWLVQTICHHLKQNHFSEKIINEIVTDMVFTHFICPAIISPDIMGIVDAPVSEEVRFNLMQIGQIIQMLALAKYEDVDPKFAEVYNKFESNLISNLIDLLLVNQSGEDVVALLSQQSDFERVHLMSTQSELAYFVEFYRILLATDEFDLTAEERQKLNKILSHLPDPSRDEPKNDGANAKFGNGHEANGKERSKQSLKHLGKVTKSKIAKSMSFSSNPNTEAGATGGLPINGNGLPNGLGQVPLASADNLNASSASTNTPMSSASSSPIRHLPSNVDNYIENEPILIFSIYTGDEHKLQPLTEEEVLKMNSIGQEMTNGEAMLVDTESVTAEIPNEKSSLANGFDGLDGLSDSMRPLRTKTTRFSLSHDDGSIGTSDNLEAVSEAPSNHSVTSSLELEENDQNDNLSDMVSANVSGRGSPNISGRDTPSSLVTDGGSLNNAMPTPQMQKLISKARSDIEDKFCKFEIKKFEGDENVSIISDTWSTDVLASDSETLDANDREHDRNFSTPLIPSAVVLPGDNNFDVLSCAIRARPGYLDVSDQRSESNWSTDVLASDSEKFAEVDTDDNASITAKSDITDGGAAARTEHERDQLAAAISAPPLEAHYVTRGGRSNRSSGGNTGSGCMSSHNHKGSHAPRSNRSATVMAGGGGAGDAEGQGSAGSSGGNLSDRSQEDTAFYDAVNSFEDANTTRAAAAGASAVVGHASSSARPHYQGVSSLARSCTRTTNQYNGENSFQQNYKSIGANNNDKAPFLTPRICRQTSAESSISNHSLNMDETASAAGCSGGSKPPKSHHHKGAIKKHKKHQNSYHHHQGSGSESHKNGPSKAHKDKNHNNNNSKDLIDFFDDFGEEKPPTAHPNTPLELPQTSNASVSDLLVVIFGEDVVERRQETDELRTVSVDGRRNAIVSKASYGNPPSLRRHQSLNYENHEIIIDNILPKRTSAMPNFNSQTDDDKQQLQEKPQQKGESTSVDMLSAKTGELGLDETLAGNEAETSSSLSSAKLGNGPVAVTPSPASALSARPSKATGAIPKSISFDASADKNACPTSSSLRAIQQRSARLHTAAAAAAAAGANSGILNKIKHGFFKHRRGNKSSGSHHHNAGGGGDGEYPATTTSSRSVSFSTGTSEVSLDMITGGLGGAHQLSRSVAGATSTGYCDITEDILAKYRRKVSTSSEATNSEGSNSAGSMANRKDSDMELKLPNLTQHDKALAFNIIKKKIRTVLSKTDLHTGDFRHTTYSNASPLLTYLQIQLAQAINLQDFQQISYVSEAIRCIDTLEANQQIQLLEELQNDIQKRQNYLQYLMRYRQNLLLIMENIEQYESRLRRESNTCNRYLMAVCVRLFLEKRQAKIEAFQEEFSRLTVSDDKIMLIEEFIECLMLELLSNGGILHKMPEWQADEARSAIERFLLHHMYQQVMFPNEDADLSRDTVLSEHIRKLQRIIHPSHPALCIPHEYLAEAPWAFAQQQLSYISAYKTPREKLQCVIRCISSIMSLLHMSSGRVPAADDLLPVLIYVVIMANPPYLLSTVEYISCFIGEKLSGEEQFHWTLFGSVVKFIKTMDYLD